MQLTSLYGGPLEFILVVESTEDPAYHSVSRLISEFEVQVKLMQFSSSTIIIAFSAFYLDICLTHAGFC